MMSRQNLTSTEVCSYEGSIDEPVELYQHESQFRFQENVVYIPHMLPPVLILEYVPHFYNYQTYEPYLINRSQVVYVPFFRQVSYVQFVPYYNSVPAQQSFSSSVQYEDDSLFNRYPTSDTESDTFETETSECGFLSEDCDSQLTESPPDPGVILVSTDSRQRSEGQAPDDDLEFEDELNSSTSDFDEVSIFSWSSSESSNPISKLITPETCNTSGSQEFIYSEDNDDLFSKYDNENIIDWQCPETISSADNTGRDIEANFINLSCLDVAEKFEVVNPMNEDQDDRRVKNEDRSSYNDDEDDGPPITLQDILASDEYWRVKREEYYHKRRNHQLYRSALEGDIRPRKSLPDVGTLATIFEDLPYPVNEPYDDGQDSNVDPYFELPPLEVKKSESSSSALMPEKKRFRNTRKLFSRLFRCFKPKTVKAGKPL